MTMTRRGATLLILAVAAGAYLLLSPPEAFAQCAMCRMGVEAGGEKAARTMNLAMLVLLVPPVSIFCSAFALVYKYRKPRGEESD